MPNTMKKRRVLFVCVHNSARSQMAQAFLKQLGSGQFEVESAGLEPGVLNPLVVTAMQEIEIDISNQPVQDVFDLVKQGKTFDYVITVCNETTGERCPIFPGQTERLHWNFEDPASFSGTDADRLAKTRIIRDQIHRRVALFVEERT